MTKIPREELHKHAKGMSRDPNSSSAAWRVYAGIIETGESTLEDVQWAIARRHPDVWREVERYFASKRLEAKMIRLPGGEHVVISDEELAAREAYQATLARNASIVKSIGNWFDGMPKGTGKSGFERAKLDAMPASTASPTNECRVLEWLECNSFEIIDDSQVEIFRCNTIDVHYDAGNEWRVIVHTATKARLIRYEMQFGIATPASVIIAAIHSASLA